MGILSIPAAEMKSKVAFRVSLSPAAVALVRSVMALFDRALLFSMGPKRMSPDMIRLAMRRIGPSKVLHGFRSIFKERARPQGYADLLSEAALAHQNQNGVRLA